jgi:hypothetical protein
VVYPFENISRSPKRSKNAKVKTLFALLRPGVFAGNKINIIYRFQTDPLPNLLPGSILHRKSYFDSFLL